MTSAGRLGSGARGSWGPVQHSAGCAVAASFDSASPLLLAPFRFSLWCSTSLVENSASLSCCSSPCPWHFGPGIPLTLANWHLRTSFCHSILISDSEPSPILQSGCLQVFIWMVNNHFVFYSVFSSEAYIICHYIGRFN